VGGATAAAAAAGLGADEQQLLDETAIDPVDELVEPELPVLPQGELQVAPTE
jgi:hypothetical protein